MTSGGVGHPYYHRPEDDTEKIDPEILRKTGQFVLQGTVNLADEQGTELLIEDRQNLYNAAQFNVTSFNPGQGEHEQVRILASNRDELMGLVLDSALAVNGRLQEEQRQAAPVMASPMRYGGPSASGKKTFNRGISDLAPFEGDTSLLLAAAEFIGFGRLDLRGDDGYWISNGHLTAEGRRAVPILEANEIWIHLASPSPDLFEEVLAAASEPFIVTGDYAVSDLMLTPINDKGVILGVSLDPAHVDGTIAALEELKARLGDTDNLVLCATTDRGMEEAGAALYMGLVHRGWEAVEIAGDRRAGGGISGNNLRVFAGANQRAFMR